MRLLLLLFLGLPSASSDCASHNFRRGLPDNEDDFVIYGLTQDCRIFFASSQQLPLLADIEVDTRIHFCYPNLVQLQLIRDTSLRLLFKQHDHGLCVLDIAFPPVKILFGPHLFTYPLNSTLPYSACSHSNGPISFLPDLSFPDPAFSDVLYFVDPSSSGSKWKARQFLANATHLQLLQIMAIDSHLPVGSVPSDFLLSLDSDKNFLFKRGRLSSSFHYECAFDLLFRPSSVMSHSGVSFSPSGISESSRWLNSLAVDGPVMVYAETDKQSEVAPTHVYVQRVGPSSPHSSPLCIARLPYRVELGIVSIRTLRKMAQHPQQSFAEARLSPPRPLHRPHHTRPHSTTPSPPKTTTTTLPSFTSTSTRPSTTTQIPASEEDEYDEDAEVEDEEEDDSTSPPIVSSIKEVSPGSVVPPREEGSSSPSLAPPETSPPLHQNATTADGAPSLPLLLLSSLSLCIVLIFH